MGQRQEWRAAGLGPCSWAAQADPSFCWVQAAGVWLYQSEDATGIVGTDRELETGLLPPSFHCSFPALGDWHQVCLCAGPCHGASRTAEQGSGQAGSPGDTPVAPNTTCACGSWFGRDIKVV